jgi:hypothetical protein
MSIIMARWKWATAPATAFRRWNVSRRRAVAEAQPQCRADGRSQGAARGVRSGTLGRPEKAATIGPLQCSRRLVRRRRSALGSLRRRDRGQRAGRVAAHSLTLCLFCRRVKAQCPILREGAAEDGRLPSTPLPPLAWPGSIIIAKPAPILLTGGQRNVRRGGDGAHSSGWEPRSAPARARYRLTPKSCPTRAGRLNAAGCQR